MQSRSQPSLLFIYVGAVATALSVIVVGLTAVVRASAGLSDASIRDKTMVELQVESSRAIRRALATPVSIPPLPPITARPARDIREAAAVPEKKPAPTKLPPAAMNAMAMDQGAARSSSYPAYDRHSPSW
jgi:hypothetical protein